MTKYLSCFLLFIYCENIQVRAQDIYNYSLRGISGDTIHFRDFVGQKILIVNTAANSEKVDQYDGLEHLYQLYKDSLTVVAVPSNSFGNELEADSTLYTNIENSYEVSYLIAAKTEVAGEDIDSLFQWLTKKTMNGVLDYPIRKDFQKFLIGTDGKLIGVFSSLVDPLDDDLQNAIKGITEQQ